MDQLTEEDYYIDENGLLVFTEKYHLKRGYCCKSGCQHCPYGFKVAEVDTTQKPEVKPEDPSSK